MEFNGLKEILETLKKNPTRTHTQNYIDEKGTEMNDIWKKDEYQKIMIIL